MATLDKTAVESSANVSLTVRLIMQGKVSWLISNLKPISTSVYNVLEENLRVIPSSFCSPYCGGSSSANSSIACAALFPTLQIKDNKIDPHYISTVLGYYGEKGRNDILG